MQDDPKEYDPFRDGWRSRCEACGAVVLVKYSDGEPMRSEDVHTMRALDGSHTLVLHHGCERGDEASPTLTLIPR